MRKFTSLILCLFIVVSLLLSTVTEVNAATVWKDKCEYVATTVALNVRKGPGLSYARKTTVSSGRQVFRIGEGNNGWSKVIVKGEVGYMSSEYLRVSTYKASKDVSSTNVYSGVSFTRVNEMVNAKQNVNIRKGPGTSYGVVGVLTPSETIIRIGVGDNGWSQIIYKDKVRYVKTSYLVDTTTCNDAKTEDKNILLPTTPMIEAVAPTTPAIVYQATTNVNVRTGPSTSCEKIGLLKTGEKITSLGSENGWQKFALNGQIVYVSGSCLKRVDTSCLDIYYTTTQLNVRSGPSTSYNQIDTLPKGTKVVVLAKSGSWYKIHYKGQTAYCHGDYLTKTKPQVEVDASGYPMTYKDSTCTITVYKEWYENAYVYAAHIQYTDYDRLWVECAKGKYNSGTETTSNAAKRVGAILAINGDYATPGNGASGYAIARKGVVCNDKKTYSEGVYNSKTGILLYGQSRGISGQQLSTLVAEGKVTDTFQFGPAFLIDGKIIGDPTSTSRAQRTFIGTNGNAGDIWLCVSDGRKNDGKSDGLNAYQCASYLASKGCTLGIPLDGGGSSTMYFNGQVLNAAKSGQRSVADFVMFK